MEEFTCRPWRRDDVAFLWDMLHESLHVRAGAEPFPRSVLDRPDIAHYLAEFGERPGDDGQVAVANGIRIGAAWCRRLDSEDPGYGYVDDETPELGMAVRSGWRGRGVGRRLVDDLTDRQPRMSLSVDNENGAAVRLYRSLGFVAIDRADGSTTMLRTGRSRTESSTA